MMLTQSFRPDRPVSPDLCAGQRTASCDLGQASAARLRVTPALLRDTGFAAGQATAFGGAHGLLGLHDLALHLPLLHASRVTLCKSARLLAHTEAEDEWLAAGCLEAV